MASNNATSTRPGPIAKRSPAACTSCRQVKLRCDAKVRFPSKCTRCEAQDKSCAFDPNFRRQSMRGLLGRTMEENARLERLLHGSSQSTQATTSEKYPVPNPYIQVGPAASSGQSGPLARSDRGSATIRKIAYVLGTTEVSIIVIEDLLEHFRKVHHSHIPIIRLDKAIELLETPQSFLIWTVVMIAGRRHSQYKDKIKALERDYRTLLSNQLVTAIRSMHTIQAFLLLCLWPLPVENQLHDPTWNYCGLVAAAAVQLQLYKNADAWGQIGNQPRQDSLLERQLTWLACFMVTTCTALDYGYAAPMQPYIAQIIETQQSLKRHLSTVFFESIDINIYKLNCQQVTNQFTIGQPTDALIQLAKTQLDQALAKRSSCSTSLFGQIDVAFAKLCLPIAVLLIFMKQRDWPFSHTENLELINGTSTAIQVVELVCKIMEEHVIHDLPKHYFHGACIATMYLVQMQALDGVIKLDHLVSRMKVSKENIVKVFREASKYPQDEVSRAASFLDLLYTAALQPDTQEFFLRTTDANTLVAAVATSAFKVRQHLHGTASERNMPYVDTISIEQQHSEETVQNISFATDFDFGLLDGTDFLTMTMGDMPF